HPLADDVPLDLAGAAGDRVLPRADHSVVPARVVRHVAPRLIEQNARPQQLAREVGDTHAQLRAEQLEDGALGPGRIPAELAGSVAGARGRWAGRPHCEAGPAVR